MPLPRFRLRTLMAVVAVAGVALAVHVQFLAREAEFAVPILMVEAYAVVVLLPPALAIGCVVHIVREDRAYAARLRRDDVPAQCPSILAEDGSPELDST